MFTYIRLKCALRHSSAATFGAIMKSERLNEKRKCLLCYALCYCIKTMEITFCQYTF